MKKLISILITFVLLIFSTELRELIKLPLLFQHYFEHKAINKDITFAIYLFDHYNSIPHTDDDEDRDNQLPFKSADQKFVLTSPAIPTSNRFVIRLLTPVVLSRSSIYKENHIPPPFLGRVWQPPKHLICSSKPIA
nr:hypothetical protein [Pedobacter panaciterrae]